jgi:phosphohistidine swiveling domain-containing protein
MSLSGQLGGKAESWARLLKAGIPVPACFAIAVEDPLDPSDIAQRLQTLVEQTAVEVVVVRSSGVGEDGTAQALAGLFQSFLDVPAEVAAVIDAAVRCRAAGATARVKSAVGKEAPMGVLVQERLRPQCSGVLFTRDPLGQTPGMVVEAVRGHLGSLVDGRQDASRWVLGVDEAPAGFRELDTMALRDIGERVEAVLGTPADIEWALAQDRLVVLQARPITGLAAPARGLDLVPVRAENAARLSPAVAQHDKIALRLVASELGIGISQGLVALASSPQAEELERAAAALAGWGEFIAVLLSPFDLDGQIFRIFGTGPTALWDLERFVETVSRHHDHFAFLLKELQATASTGVAVRLPDGKVRVELVHGHFVTKGFADPTVYLLGADGGVVSHTPGRQEVAMQVVEGRKVREAVSEPIAATPAQLAAIHRAAAGLAERYPGAGVEFGFTPAGEFFLVDLYQSEATAPPDQADVLSYGRVVGRVRVLDLPEDAIEESIERHVHSRRDGAEGDSVRTEAEILVVKRPLHVLDRLIYEAHPGTLGFICEGGALLCHLAVVMREHGVPGLIVPDATAVFTNGERLVLDTRPGSPAGFTRL